MKTIIFCVQVLLIATLVLASSDSVLMRDIQALTLKENEWTSFRRTKALPQLKCIGGDAQGQSNFFPKVVQCKNQGQDDRGIVQWKCDAELDERVRLGKVTVSCEGYSRPGDAYVLRGSCGLEYELWQTDAGKKDQQRDGRRRGGSRRGGFRSRQKQQQQQAPQREQRTYQQSYQEARYSTNTQPNADYGSWIGLAFVIVAILVLVYIFSGPSNGPTVVRATPSVNPQQQPPQQRIYPDVPSYNPEYVPSYDTPSYNTYSAPTTTTTNTSWTSTAAGFGAGYLLGRATAPTTTQQQPTEIHHHYDSNVYPEPSRNYESPSSDDDDKQEYSTHTSHGYGDSNSR